MESEKDEYGIENVGNRIVFDRIVRNSEGKLVRYVRAKEEPAPDPDECFVATAVYGDVNAPQVQKLREIRDNVLVQNSLGRAFVDFYYSGAGKRTANFIKTQLPSTIPILRRGLDIIVNNYSSENK